jgi:multidrug efflux pump subunit AcrA (membrane-fusion protein)
LIHSKEKLAALVAIAIMTAACASHSEPVQVETAAADATPTVPVIKATRNDLSSDLNLTGEFQPYQEVDVMAKVAGYVKSIKVDIGDRVTEGQLLATL